MDKLTYIEFDHNSNYNPIIIIYHHDIKCVQCFLLPYLSNPMVLIVVGIATELQTLCFHRVILTSG